jgi:hypothetical protein
VSTGWEDANEAIDAAVAGGRAHVNGERAKASKVVRDRQATRRDVDTDCARLAAPSFAGEAADSRHPFTRAPEENLAALEIELTDAELDALG